ncbi:MAG: hypothetical protein BGP24_01325 [Lysobacterales bacterium 69-70]|nr:hypothetical protein [Xanthomonadaceae bacterium]ODU36066.1 MAG: hypothetical protein ABS97_01645 [Xanthomonadaceae bacterium SCN 69-320]ODV18191.1 MAG: hypothetical protein ABT27_14795 [Xanthomonadaceae bacterium SCN 69-25]OJY99474.1 MAG: hypothetical protein BGP24_01325 [Xanthomonadales bacterium 69-70]
MYVKANAALAIALALTAGVATAKQADTTHAVPNAPAPNASEDYPVSYPGGNPPAAVTGALDGDDSTYNRLTANCGGASAVGTAVFYDTITVTYTGTATGSITLTTTGGDTFLTAYNGTFNPASPSTNCVGSNDDTAGVAGNGSQLANVTFTPGQTVVFVVSSFDNAAQFSWTADFTGTTPVALQSFRIE